MPKATNLPEAWTVTEDARLLLAAQRMGYYPNNARRQAASDGFLAKFMNLYTPVRVHTPASHPTPIRAFPLCCSPPRYNFSRLKQPHIEENKRRHER